MSDCCSSNLSSLSFTGPQGISISSITSTAVVGGSNLTITLSNGGTQGPFFIASGTNGTNGAGIVSIAWTSNSASSPQGTLGTIDTYTCYTGPGNTNPVGAFTVTNAAVVVTPTVTNVGIPGASIYKTGTSNPFEMRKIQSSDSTILINQNTDDVDVVLNTIPWKHTLPSGSVPSINPVFASTPGAGFTGVANSTLYNLCGAKYIPLLDKVVLKGAFELSGGTGITYNPVGADQSYLIHIMFLPAALVPTNPSTSIDCTAVITGTGGGRSSIVNCIVNSGGLYLRVNSKWSNLYPGQTVSLENTMYSLNDL
jgi:hypothetical protein